MRRIVTTGAAVFFGVASIGLGTGTAEAAITPESPVMVSRVDYDQQLRDLAGKQSQSYINSLVTSEGPAELLYDTTKKRYTAAIDTSGVSARAITSIGPGCSSTSACIWTGSTPNGYGGLGTLNGSWKNSPKFASGDMKTTLSSGGGGWFACPNKTTTFTTPQNFTKLVREFGAPGC